jgi:hypothetical protein
MLDTVLSVVTCMDELVKTMRSVVRTASRIGFEPDISQIEVKRVTDVTVLLVRNMNVRDHISLLYSHVLLFKSRIAVPHTDISVIKPQKMWECFLFIAMRMKIWL